MSPRCASERLAHVLQDAQLLVERAADQKGQIGSGMTAAEGDFHRATAAISPAADDLDADAVRHRCFSPFERTLTAIIDLIACDGRIHVANGDNTAEAHVHGLWPPRLPR